jgi:hypothetical protein
MSNDQITAYHGTPHDFDQFDTSKIGTGEGAQSYGHGLYFAESEPVAKGYRDKLSSVSPKALEQYFKPGETIAGYGGKDKVLDYDPQSRVVKVQGIDSRGKLEPHVRTHQTMPDLNEVNAAFKERGLDPHIPGHMYEVHINAHPHHMLDWDKPLSEQPHITSKVMTPELIDQINRYRAGWKLGDIKPNFSNLTGEDLYAHLSQPVSGQKGNDKAASKHLSNLGIHGIRYLDAGSRNAQGDPTHNYVVFDHNRVSVKRKYAQGGDVEAYGDGGSTHEPHQRAEEQGYSIKGYHFTRGPKAQSIAKSKQFDPYLSEGGENATFFWDNPQAAHDWAHFAGGVDPNKPQEKMTPNELDRLSRFAPSMLPVRIHPGKHTIVNWPEAVGFHHYASHAMKKLIQNARSEGYDTIRIKNMREGDVEDELGKDLETPHDQIAVLNPAMIRSEFAQFDPARQHENDIGARKGGTIDRENVDYKKMPHSRIVEHALGKISAPLPALDPHLMAAIAGRRS